MTKKKKAADIVANFEDLNAALDQKIAQLEEKPKEEAKIEFVPEIIPEIEAICSPTIIQTVVSEILQETADQAVDPAEKEIATIEGFFDEYYFQKIAESGIDLSQKGFWQRMYANFVNNSFRLIRKRVLDIGCAFGAIPSSFSDIGMQVKAMDISEYAAMKCPFKNIDFILSPSWDMAIQSKSIEFIHSMFCFNAIPEHLMKKTFEEMDRVCIPNSLIFIILNLGKENKQDGNYNFLYTEEFFNNIANELGMTSEKAKYHIRLMTMHSPGWDFMRQYKWSYLLYRTKK